MNKQSNWLISLQRDNSDKRHDKHKKWNNSSSSKTTTTGMLLKLWYSVHLRVYLFIYFTSPFLIFRSLTPASTNNIPHIFLPSPITSCSRLLNGCYTVTFPSNVGKSKCSYALTKVSYFYDLEKPGMMGIPSRILGDTGTKIFKHIKSGRVEFLIAVNIRY